MPTAVVVEAAHELQKRSTPSRSVGRVVISVIFTVLAAFVFLVIVGTRTAIYLHVRKHGHPRKLCFYIAMSPSRAELHARLARYNIPDPEQPPPPPPPRQPRPPGAWKARFGRMVPRRFRDDVESRGQDHAAVASPAHASGSSTPAPAWKEDGDELPGYHDTRTLPPRYQDTICLGA